MLYVYKNYDRKEKEIEKETRFVVHSTGAAVEWQINNWSLLSYDRDLLSKKFCVSSSVLF